MSGYKHLGDLITQGGWQAAPGLNTYTRREVESITGLPIIGQQMQVKLLVQTLEIVCDGDELSFDDGRGNITQYRLADALREGLT